MGKLKYRSPFHRSASVAIVLLGVLLSGLVAFAGGKPSPGVEVLPDGPSVGMMNNQPLENPPLTGTQEEPVSFQMNIGCYPTNLRYASNPLNPNGTLLINFGLANGTAFYVSVPTLLFFPEYGGGYQRPTVFVKKNGGWKPSSAVSGWGSYYDIGRKLLGVKADLPTAKAVVDGSGNMTVTKLPLYLTSLGIYQIGVGMGGQYYGSDGPLTQNGYIYYSASLDGRQHYLCAYFPGAAYPGQLALWEYNAAGVTPQWGFCGGWYSPLMLFFDDKRPQYTGETDFPLRATPGMSYWVEPGAPGYLLAIDRNRDGKISEGKELFGPGDANGFEALKKLDGNGDGLLDARDPQFRRLLAWKDADGNGKSTKQELEPISKLGVESIRLTHRSMDLVPHGGRAEEREESTFTYRDPATGTRKTAKIIDIWFAPRPEKAPAPEAKPMVHRIQLPQPFGMGAAGGFGLDPGNWLLVDVLKPRRDLTPWEAAVIDWIERHERHRTGPEITAALR